jgi:hypothetical protein
VNYVRGGLFGPYNLPEAKQYRDEKRTPLSEKQSAEFKKAEDKQAAYQKVIDDRQKKREIDAAKDKIQSAGEGQTTIGNTRVYWDAKTGKARSKSTKVKVKVPKVKVPKAKKVKKLKLPKVKVKKVKRRSLKLVKRISTA